MYPPRTAGAQHVPLWKIAGPHTGKLKPGPSRGPVFYRALPTVDGRKKILSGTAHKPTMRGKFRRRQN
jgi:hypothetical protein